MNALTEVTIYRGPFGLWHVKEVLPGFDGTNLRTACKSLKACGITTVHIKRGGAQRPWYETRTL